MSDLNVGQVIRLRSFEDHRSSSDVSVSLTFRADGRARRRKASEQKVFVCVVLGMEMLHAKDDERLSPEDVLKSLGWTPPPSEDEDP